MVELTGRKTHCGIAALLGNEDREDGLRPLLEEYTPDATEKEDPDREKLRGRLQKALSTLLDARLAVSVEEVNDEHFNLSILADEALRLPSDVQAQVRPATLPAGAMQTIAAAALPIEFSQLSMTAITAFIAFHLRAEAGNKVEDERFVLRLPIRNAPSYRRERILQNLLTDSDQLMRLLLLLLSDEGLRVHDFIKRSSTAGGQIAFGAPGGSTLLESMLRALHRNPEWLDDVEHLIEDLRKTLEGRALLPPGLDRIWEPIRSARQEMRS